jgi:hypothetical protein
MYLSTFIKSRRSCGKFLKRSAVLLLFLLIPSIPLLAKLKLVQQSLKVAIQDSIRILCLLTPVLKLPDVIKSHCYYLNRVGLEKLLFILCGLLGFIASNGDPRYLGQQGAQLAHLAGQGFLPLVIGRRHTATTTGSAAKHTWNS